MRAGTPEFIVDLSEALGIGPGDEVITSPYTDMGTIASILSARALPVLADIDRYSFQIDPADVERKITRHTKAIMPIHIMGQACEMDKIMDKMESLLNKTDQR